MTETAPYKLVDGVAFIDISHLVLDAGGWAAFDQMAALDAARQDPECRAIYLDALGCADIAQMRSTAARVLAEYCQ